MAQGYGSYNQFGQYGQLPGQAQQHTQRFGTERQQYPQGTFQPPAGNGSSGAANTSDLSQPPPTGGTAPASSTPPTDSQPATTSAPAPPPVTSGAAGQQAPADQAQPTGQLQASQGQYPQGTFPGTTSLYGGSLGQNSTGPVNMILGQQGAAGAWDGGYNPFYAPPQQTSAPINAPAPASTPVAASVPAQQAPVSTPQPSALPATPAYQGAPTASAPASSSGLTDYWGRPITGAGAQLNSGTADWNNRQQMFTGNNQGYASSGYWGNDAQVAAQQAERAQANSIPLGVLGASFGAGGADYGGAQNAQNSMSGLNGARNWADPSVANFGVFPPGTFR